MIALDFALPMVQHARRKGGWLRRPRCLCADAERLPLADGTVDRPLNAAEAAAAGKAAAKS